MTKEQKAAKDILAKHLDADMMAFYPNLVQSVIAAMLEMYDSKDEWVSKFQKWLDKEIERSRPIGYCEVTPYPYTALIEVKEKLVSLLPHPTTI